MQFKVDLVFEGSSDRTGLGININESEVLELVCEYTVNFGVDKSRL